MYSEYFFPQSRNIMELLLKCALIPFSVGFLLLTRFQQKWYRVSTKVESKTRFKISRRPIYKLHQTVG